MVRRYALALGLASVGVLPFFVTPAAADMDRGLALRSVRLYVSQATAAEKKDPAEADTLWEKAIRVGMQGLQGAPDDPELNIMVGKAYCKRGHPKEAGERFKAGLEGFAKKPGKPEWKRNLESERYNCWAQHLNEGVMWFGEGQKLQSGGQADSAAISFNKAIEAFNHTMEVWPDEPTVQVYPPLAFSYIFTNRKEEGRDILVKALAVKPGDSTIVRNLVAVDVDRGQEIMSKDIDRATSLFLEADSLDQSTVDPLFRLANLYATRAGQEGANLEAQKKDYRQANEYYEKLINRFP